VGFGKYDRLSMGWLSFLFSKASITYDIVLTDIINFVPSNQMNDFDH
jgi:hypothetical protein